METVVVDTDVISYLFKGDTRGELYSSHLEDRLGVISFMTLAELDYWPAFHNRGQRRRTDPALFLQPYIVVESDRELCRMWAEVRHQVQRSGFQIETADAWIAATALLHQIPLVTHNRSHFIHVNGLTIISESPV
ncbi:MAG TPA: type II toxin-antitoxin system VapC family toxin [Blastocatellia bacterium]|nr:type II toxin-antitoxin system VapC family toxin [Blastocatellia bacterium]